VGETGEVKDMEINVAVKVDSRITDASRIENQAVFMALTQKHEGFLKLYGAFWDESKTKYTIVMELAKETLYDRISRWGPTRENKDKASREAETLIACQTLIGSMLDLHTKSICHRDIKPENIFIGQDDKLKIADFDISKEVRKNDQGFTVKLAITSISKTECYQSPEIELAEKKLIQNIDYYASDVFSLGLTMLLMATGSVLPGWNILGVSSDMNREMVQKMQSELQLKLNNHIDASIVNENLKSILINMLVVDADKRLRFRALENQLSSSPTTNRKSENSELVDF
jgi:serine/threonine protein kinase